MKKTIAWPKYYGEDSGSHTGRINAADPAPMNAPRGMPSEPKLSITIRIDADVVRWFKKDGAGWQTRMNDALKLWVERYSTVNEEE